MVNKNLIKNICLAFIIFTSVVIAVSAVGTRISDDSVLINGTTELTSKKIVTTIYVDKYDTFQEAIDASDPDSDGEADYDIALPNGNYDFDTMGQIVLINGSVFVGLGNDVNIIMSDTTVLTEPSLGGLDTNYAMITNSRPLGHWGNSNITLKNINIYWGNTTKPSWAGEYFGTGIALHGVINPTIENVHVYNTPSFGMWITGFNDESNIHINTNGKILNNHIEHAGYYNSSTLLAGILLTNVCTDTLVEGNNINNSLNGIIEEDRCARNEITNNIITNGIEHINGSGLRSVTSSGLSKFTNNIVDGSYYGFYSYGNSYNEISGNTFNNITVDGICVGSGDNGLYTNNIITNCGGRGINETILNSYNIIRFNNLQYNTLPVSITSTSMDMSNNRFFGYNVRRVTTSTTLTFVDNVLLADATSGEVIVTLPTTAPRNGEVLHIKKIDSSANNVSIQGGTNPIDGITTGYNLTSQYDVVELIADSDETTYTKWWII